MEQILTPSNVVFLVVKPNPLTITEPKELWIPPCELVLKEGVQSAQNETPPDSTIWYAGREDNQGAQIKSWVTKRLKELIGLDAFRGGTRFVGSDAFEGHDTLLL